MVENIEDCYELGSRKGKAEGHPLPIPDPEGGREGHQAQGRAGLVLAAPGGAARAVNRRWRDWAPFHKAGSPGVPGPHPTMAELALLSASPTWGLSTDRRGCLALSGCRMLAGRKLFLSRSRKVHPWLLSREGPYFESVYKSSAILQAHLEFK